MIDFRYHALTLVAVLVSLVIGLLLGVAIGDQGLVSGAEEDLRQDLRSDVEAARASSRELEEQLERRVRYEEQTYGAVVGERLEGRRVAVITLHQPPSTTFEDVRRAIPPTGGDVAFVGRLRLPPDLGELAGLIPGSRFEALADEPGDLLQPFGERIGEQLVSGGRLARDARQRLFASSSGSLEGAEAVVLIRAEPPEGRDAQERDREDAYVRGLIDGMRGLQTPVVGVERTDTDPSQVEWYSSRGVASVDNVDQTIGRTSLVLVLAGGGAGAYGVKDSAEALLPEALVREP